MAAPAKQKRPRGRPAKAADVRKRNILAIRARDELKAALGRRAEANQRSLSEEAETLLEQALLSEGMLDQVLDLAFGRRLAGLLLILGNAMRETGSSAGFMATRTLAGATDWLGNFYAFSQAIQAASAVFEALCPEDDGIRPPKMGKPFPDGPDFDAVMERLGAGHATTLLTAVADADEARSTGHDQVAEQARVRLGPAAVERIRDWTRLGMAHHHG